MARRIRAACVAVAAGVLAGIPTAIDVPSPSKVLAAAGASASPTTSTSAPAIAPASAAVAAPAPVEAEAVLAPPPESFDAAPVVAAPPPALLRAAATAAPTGGVWAVVIGIDDYPGQRSDLRASVADADTVDWTLASYGVPASRRLVLRNTQATAGVITDSLRWLVAHAGPDATAVVFYAGHVRQLGGGTEAIVAADGRLVTDRTVADLLRPLAARSTWVVMASCFGGGFDEVLAPNRILTAAAGPRSLAYENARYGNSYLVEYVVQRAMMEGAAPDSVERAYAWAYAALQRDHPNRLPVQYDRLDGELSLGTPPRRGAAPQPAPAGPSSPPSTTTTTAPPPEDDDDNACLLSLGSLATCDDRPDEE